MPNEAPGRQKVVAAATALSIALASGHEGLKFTPYYDPPGILTVCRGHTGNIVNRRYSLAECDRFMTDDMRHAVETVERCQPGLPMVILAAFADAVFNMGRTIACDRVNSTAARMLDLGRKTGDFLAACNQLLRWDKAKVAGVLTALPGLTKRRGEERALCVTWRDS
jgi:GH24 family phage-related lysozyme (muramidase)